MLGGALGDVKPPAIGAPSTVLQALRTSLRARRPRGDAPLLQPPRQFATPVIASNPPVRPIAVESQALSLARIARRTTKARARMGSPHGAGHIAPPFITASQAWQRTRMDLGFVPYAAIIGSQAEETPGFTIAIKMVDSDEVGVANVTNLYYAFFDESRVDQFTAPATSGTTAIDSDGYLRQTILGSALSSGQVGYIVVSDSDGNPDGSWKGYQGPVRVP